GINKSSSLFAPGRYDLYVIRRNDYAGIMAYMPGKLFIRLTVNGELFFACLPQNANCFFGFIPNFKFAFQPEPIISLQNIGCIPCKITFREAEIMDGIQQICFSDPIAS